ncbi:Energy-coupling factor transporter ATP-binding protein EcfA2 OS=Castellaniella defragrans OX=75697 GN=HNR28_000639 PE=4 SV=1 [Castellaniella defragrans]
MRLRHVRIEQLRQFREPLEIRDIVPGLNLFVGPNESGKSTVVRAIRAAFFERYKSASVEDLQPWGDSAAAPSVTLEFDWQGERWTLTKSFLRRKRCDLDIAGTAFSGEQAEEKLADLLGYQFAGKGASKAEHWGIPGLLWIEQGTGQDIQAPVQHAGGYLKSILGQSLGEVASSAGDALIAQVEQEWLKLWTAKKRTPTREYAEALERQAQCEAQLGALDAQIATYREQVDRLAELRRRQEDDAARPWEAYRDQVAQAQQRLAEVQGWVREQRQDEQALQHARTSQQMCRDQLEFFATQQNELIRRDQARDEAQKKLQACELETVEVQGQARRAQRRYRDTEAACAQAVRQEKRAALMREWQGLEQQAAELQDRVRRVQALRAEWLAQQETLQALRVDADALARLRALVRQRDEIDLVQQSRATRLRYELLPERSIRIGDEAATGQGERLLLEAVTLDVEGVGRLWIRPGGEDLGDLARRRDAAHGAVQALLAELRVDSLADAEQGAERHRELQESTRRAEVLLATLAPEGIEALLARQQQDARRQEALRAELAELGDPPTDPAPAVRAAETARDGALAQLKRAEQAVSRHEQDLGLARQAVDNAQREWRQLEAALQAPDRREREQASSRQLLEQQAREASLQNAVAKRQQQIESAHPEALELDIKRLGNAADAAETEAAARREELAGLVNRLEVLGASGLEEQRAECAQQVEYWGRRCAQFKRRALALDLLLELLRAQRQALTRQIQAPLQRHLQHYLQLLFAQSRLTVGEDLVPQQLVRGDERQESRGDYAALSFGAREQIGLISRLAYADLLREAGRPTLVILDDALVHSDSLRLTQMKRVLFDAAQRHQVLLFSCHPDRWRDLGVAAVEMQSLRDLS